MVSDGRLPCCRNVRIVSRYFATRLAVLQWTPFAGHDRASLQESYCFAGDGRPSLDTICVPIFRYSSRCTTTDAQTVRPYRSRIALLETDALRWTRSCVPIFRYSSCCTTTDAQTVRPYRSRIALLEIGTLWLDTSRASLQKSYCFAGDRRFLAGY